MSCTLYQPHTWLGDAWGSSRDMFFHLITSLGAVEVVFVEASSFMTTAQVEK